MSREARTCARAIAGRLGLALWCGTCLVLAGDAPAKNPHSACFQDGFDLDLVIEETGTMAASASPDWWVSSGARFLSSGGLGMTLQGFLPENDRWRIAYSQANPLDTDDGYRPQNVFRMVTKAEWLVNEEEVYFHIRAVNTTDSPNRQGHNGVFLFSRYLDQDNLYIAGLRVDGAAVVKRKLAGAYTTLAYQKVYPGAYDRDLNPNLLPVDRWIGIRSITRDKPDGSVAVRVDVNDPGAAADWFTVFEAVDASGSAIHSAGHGGIRTDFLDVELDGYSAGECP